MIPCAATLPFYYKIEAKKAEDVLILSQLFACA